MISVSHLSKYYGTHLAVDDVSFEITEGHVYGFLGPNGAGKSTTMNIIAGCLSASDGTVCIDGHDIFEEPNAAKRCIGYLPEHPPLYPSESPFDYLRFVGEAKGLRSAALAEQIEQAIERTGLRAVQNRRIATLSKGYQQRVGIAQALLGNPKVIILDEPTVGLDPIQMIEIRELITELGKTHTVIFSSHILSEVQAICDRILMIAKGKLVAFGRPEELQQMVAANELTLTTDATAEQLCELLAELADIERIDTEAAEHGLTQARLQIGKHDLYAVSGAVFRAVAASGYLLYEMKLKHGSLEDVFIELSEGATELPTETVLPPESDEKAAPPEEAADIAEEREAQTE